MIRFLFWGLVALDVLGVLLFFLLALAAAGSTRTPATQLIVPALVVPALILAAAVLLFTRASHPGLHALALLIAATPVLLAGLSSTYAVAQYRGNTNERGDMTYFRPGPMRKIVEAIRRSDAATVARLVNSIDVNRTGLTDMTLLMLAMRMLRVTPDQHEVLRVILDAGADPNAGAQSEFPLNVAIQVSGKAGTAPVTMLLDAGANPNLIEEFGQPVWWQATGQSSTPETLALLLDRGADVNFVHRNGQTALFSAAAARNWKAALLLLERGADPKQGRSVNGLSFPSLIESYAGSETTDDYRTVRRFLQRS